MSIPMEVDQACPKTLLQPLRSPWYQQQQQQQQQQQHLFIEHSKHYDGAIICSVWYIWGFIIVWRKNYCQFLQGTGRTYETKCGGLCIGLCVLFLITSGMFLPRISKIGWNLTKLWQIKKGDVFFWNIVHIKAIIFGYFALNSVLKRDRCCGFHIQLQKAITMRQNVAQYMASGDV